MVLVAGVVSAAVRRAVAAGRRASAAGSVAVLVVGFRWGVGRRRPFHLFTLWRYISGMRGYWVSIDNGAPFVWLRWFKP